MRREIQRLWALALLLVAVASQGPPPGSAPPAPTPAGSHPAVAAQPAPQRDCSHLSGRLLADCRCKGALAAVRMGWRSGEVMTAVATAEPCGDGSSPGLDAADRVLLQAVLASAARVRTGLALAKSGELLGAVAELAELFAEARKVPETPGDLLHGPLAHVHCRWFVLALRHEVVAGMPVPAATVALAERVGDLCADALSVLIATNNSTAGSRRGVVSLSGMPDADAWAGGDEGRELAWPHSAEPPAPWLAAARMLSLVVGGKPAQAVQEAREHGAVLEAGRLDWARLLSRVLVPQDDSSNRTRAPSSASPRRPATFWGIASLLLCRRWNGLQLSACQPCGATRVVSPLFSVRAGVPICARLGQSTAPARRTWFGFSVRHVPFPDAFHHPVLADAWGEALAHDCLARFPPSGGASESEEGRGQVEEEVAAVQRSRCLVEAREVTRHSGSASAVLTVEAVRAWEAGSARSFLRTLDLLLDSELARDRHVLSRPWRLWRPWPLALYQEARAVQDHNPRVAVLAHRASQAVLTGASRWLRAISFRWSRFGGGKGGAEAQFSRLLSADRLRPLAESRRFQQLLLWRVRALLSESRISEACATALALEAAAAARTGNVSTAASSPAATRTGPAAAFAHGHPQEDDALWRQLARVLSMLESSLDALKAAEALELSVGAGYDEDAVARQLWRRERKWRSGGGRRGSGADAEAGVQARLLAVHTQRAEQTLALLASALDDVASTAVEALQTVREAQREYAVRRVGALLGVAVEVERWRLVAAARLRRLEAKPSLCMHSAVLALALHQGLGAWVEAPRHSAAAHTYRLVLNAVGGAEVQAGLARLKTFDHYRARSEAGLGVGGWGAKGGQRSLGVVWGLEVLRPFSFLSSFSLHAVDRIINVWMCCRECRVLA